MEGSNASISTSIASQTTALLVINCATFIGPNPIVTFLVFTNEFFVFYLSRVI